MELSEGAGQETEPRRVAGPGMNRAEEKRTVQTVRLRGSCRSRLCCGSPPLSGETQRSAGAVRSDGHFRYETERGTVVFRFFCFSEVILQSEALRRRVKMTGHGYK